MSSNPAHSVTLAHLVRIADLLIEHGITDEAANLLAFVMAQTEVDPTTFDHAEDLFLDLEAEICPRVIWDAREFARSITLEQIIAHLRAHMPQLLP
jgi:hypothetical protein